MLEKVLLTEKERSKLEHRVMDADTEYGGIVGALAFPEILCKAQCLKLLGWMDELCEHPHRPKLRRQCVECMAELRKELGE